MKKIKIRWKCLFGSLPGSLRGSLWKSHSPLWLLAVLFLDCRIVDSDSLGGKPEITPPIPIASPLQSSGNQPVVLNGIAHDVREEVSTSGPIRIRSLQLIERRSASGDLNLPSAVGTTGTPAPSGTESPPWMRGLAPIHMIARTVVGAEPFSVYRQEGELLAPTNSGEIEKLWLLPKFWVPMADPAAPVRGYRVAEARGSESRVRLSVPFLLLDGSVDVIPLPGAGATVGGEGTALIVPLSHRMTDRAAFERVKASEQLQVQTMDLCPKRIRLIYRNREFLGRIEVRSASLCPVNELNRVEFEAKEGEVKEILEASALQTQRD